MFTGIVEELGTVVSSEPLGDSARLTISGATVTGDAHHGDSIAVNGVCLTVVEFGDGQFSADVMAESLSRSSLGTLSVGSPVNLERAMAAGGRFGGHVVQGHVDGTGEIVAITPSEQWTVVRVSVPATLAKYIVEKGSITLDGISLTVSAISDGEPDWLEVSLIPTTLDATTLGRAHVGDILNIEVDIIAKYVERLTARDEKLTGEPRKDAN